MWLPLDQLEAVVTPWMVSTPSVRASNRLE
jgi:hypothetical protein